MKQRFARTWILCLVLQLISCSAVTQGMPDSAPSAQDASLRRTLQDLDALGSIRYAAAFRDLHDGRTTQAIVYLTGRDWCGKSGCRTLILTPERTSWKVIGDIPMSRPPIYVLRNRSHGWHSISVSVCSGGITQCSQAEVPYNGKTYLMNSNVWLGERLEPSLGEVVISSERGAARLYER
jgi:hypothetical protein